MSLEAGNTNRAAAEPRADGTQSSDHPYIFESLIMPTIAKDLHNFFSIVRRALRLGR